MTKQTGLLFKFSEKDFIAGVNSPLVSSEVMPSGDWRQYLPVEEKQYKDFTFDTMSCTSFSALNVIETWINFLMKDLSAKQKDWLDKNGYIENGKVDFSDRFTAIMSGTMEQGNYFQAVLDSIRKDGLIPEKDFPFGGNSWKEYHDKKNITEAMKEKGKKFLEIFNISYEWTPVGDNLFIDLRYSPLQVAIPQTATHAVMLPKLTHIFDTYPPFLYQRNVSLAYAMRIFVKVNKEQPEPVTPKYKYFNPKSDPKMVGVKHETMLKLDELRELCGFPIIITSGVRSKAENDKLKGSAKNSGHLRGYEVDIACTDSFRRNKIIENSYKVGFTRRGVGNTFVHLGIDPSLPQNVIWLYD